MTIALSRDFPLPPLAALGELFITSGQGQRTRLCLLWANSGYANFGTSESIRSPILICINWIGNPPCLAI